MSLVDQSSSVKLVSFTEAIISKYLDDGELNDGDPGISFPTFGGGTRSLMYERSDKLNRDLKALEKRTEIDLKCCSIGSVGDDYQLFDKLRNVKVLDVAFNRLTSWDQIATIVVKLKSLRHIIVSGNPLEILSDRDCENLSDSFSKLKVVTMGKLNYNWNEIKKCCQLMWPRIEELDAFSNSIHDITVPQISFDNLTSLTLNDNQIVHWKFINNLCHLKRLTCLKLVNCGLESVEIDEKACCFPDLKHLDLKTNNLKSWKDIANLNKLPALEELIVRDNPLIKDMHFDYAFNFILSIVGRLKYLNRQQITSALRKDGELHYMRFYYPKYLKALENNDRTFFEENPRYLDILQEYGAPLDLAPKNKKQAPNKLIGLTFINPALGVTLNKKIPRTISITSLKNLVKKLLSIDDMEEIVLWVKCKNDVNQDIEYPLDREEHDLDFYSVEDGDQIIVKSC